MQSIISIHQPNFFGYYPFFEKIKQADKFVILTNCQFEKNNYQNRFNIGEEWFTLSVKSGNCKIHEKEYANPYYDWGKIKKRLFKYKFLDIFDDCICNNLSVTNTNIINKICNLLKIKTKILYDFPTNLTGTNRLVELCTYYESNHYLSGPSGKKYLDIKAFHDNNINLSFLDCQNKKPIIHVLAEDIFKL